MKELLHLGLQLGGWSLVVLCIASLWIPKMLGWREKVAGLTPLMREVWWTYSCYIWGSHVFFAVLALGFPDWLTGRSPAAAAMSGFMLLWWSVRLWLQFFGYDLAEVATTPANRIAKHLLTLLFLSLVTLYSLLLAWNAGWIGTGEL
ncbi:hypothetical protein [Luteolibacter marinus]|uniref:hypothetical protein n=1 Tax=Luteolibacter marinus TaxID=2776705 RepID=UPI001868BC5E|nr:hypothetical protein [Luteolibacter marinus]